jgi:integrase
MARKTTGTLVPPRNDQNGWAIRFSAYGKRRYEVLGTSEDGWNRAKAEAALRHTLADVDRGIWKPRERQITVEAPEAPTFHEFASEWFEDAEAAWSEATKVDYRWRLTNHLLPYFAKHRLTAISVEEVDRYRRQKVRESQDLREFREANAKLPKAKRKRLPRPLSNGTINKTIRLLAVILDQAVEYGHLDRNPAQGRRRLLKESKPSRSFLQPEQVAALLSAAGKLDAEARFGDTRRRRPLLAVLTLAGLRIGEALNLRWRDVSLGARKLRVTEAKTDAGVREVDLTPTLQELLSEYRTRSKHTEPGDLVFPTAKGRPDNASNVRERFFAGAVRKANEELEKAGQDPISNVTPHSLRRTFISLLFSLPQPPSVPYVMAQVGHNDPKVTLGIYAQVIASKDDHGAALDGLVGDIDGSPESVKSSA